MPITENSVFYSHELSNEEYHADPAIGSSGIKAFKECPFIYYDNYLSPNKPAFDESKTTRIGSFAHIRLLEPEKFKREFIVSPEFSIVNKGKINEKKTPMNGNHTDWKEFNANALAQGKKAILFSDFYNIENMARMIMKSKLASSMLMNGQEEMSFFAKDTETGLMLKARPDYLVKLPNEGVVIVDYKTTTISMKPRKQSNHAYGLGRHIQAAHHKKVTEMATGGQVSRVVYVTQMQERPWLIRYFNMPLHSIERGNNEIHNYLSLMADCVAQNEWPSYPEEIEDYVEPPYLDHEID